MIQEPTNDQYASAEFEIGYSLLHDVVLMEVRLFVMKYEAKKRREENEKKESIESEIDKTRIDELKEELQKIDDECDLESARRYFTKNNLEGERPTKFFCSMNKKTSKKYQFETLNVKETNERGEETIRVVTKLKEAEWEVRKLYWNLYRKEAIICDKNYILDRIGDVKKISAFENENLEKKITMEVVSITVENTRNNVAPGAGNFTGAFYKGFCWVFLKKKKFGAMHEIFKK